MHKTQTNYILIFTENSQKNFKKKYFGKNYKLTDFIKMSSANSQRNGKN